MSLKQQLALSILTEILESPNKIFQIEGRKQLQRKLSNVAKGISAKKIKEKIKNLVKKRTYSQILTSLKNQAKVSEVWIEGHLPEDYDKIKNRQIQVKQLPVTSIWSPYDHLKLLECFLREPVGIRFYPLANQTITLALQYLSKAKTTDEELSKNLKHKIENLDSMNKTKNSFLKKGYTNFPDQQVNLYSRMKKNGQNNNNEGTVSTKQQLEQKSLKVKTEIQCRHKIQDIKKTAKTYQQIIAYLANKAGVDQVWIESMRNRTVYQEANQFKELLRSVQQNQIIQERIQRAFVSFLNFNQIQINELLDCSANDQISLEPQRVFQKNLSLDLAQKEAVPQKSENFSPLNIKENIQSRKNLPIQSAETQSRIIDLRFSLILLKYQKQIESKIKFISQRNTNQRTDFVPLKASFSNKILNFVKAKQRTEIRWKQILRTRLNTFKGNVSQLAEKELQNVYVSEQEMRKIIRQINQFYLNDLKKEMNSFLKNRFVQIKSDEEKFLATIVSTLEKHIVKQSSKETKSADFTIQAFKSKHQEKDVLQQIVQIKFPIIYSVLLFPLKDQQRSAQPQSPLLDSLKDRSRQESQRQKKRPKSPQAKERSRNYEYEKSNNYDCDQQRIDGQKNECLFRQCKQPIRFDIYNNDSSSEFSSKFSIPSVGSQESLVLSNSDMNSSSCEIQSELESEGQKISEGKKSVQSSVFSNIKVISEGLNSEEYFEDDKEDEQVEGMPQKKRKLNEDQKQNVVSEMTKPDQQHGSHQEPQDNCNNQIGIIKFKKEKTEKLQFQSDDSISEQISKYSQIPAIIQFSNYHQNKENSKKVQKSMVETSKQQYKNKSIQKKNKNKRDKSDQNQLLLRKPSKRLRYKKYARKLTYSEQMNTAAFLSMNRQYFLDDKTHRQKHNIQKLKKFVGVRSNREWTKYLNKMKQKSANKSLEQGIDKLEEKYHISQNLLVSCKRLAKSYMESSIDNLGNSTLLLNTYPMIFMNYSGKSHEEDLRILLRKGPFIEAKLKLRNDDPIAKQSEIEQINSAEGLIKVQQEKHMSFEREKVLDKAVQQEKIDLEKRNASEQFNFKKGEASDREVEQSDSQKGNNLGKTGTSEKGSVSEKGTNWEKRGEEQKKIYEQEADNEQKEIDRENRDDWYKEAELEKNKFFLKGGNKDEDEKSMKAKLKVIEINEMLEYEIRIGVPRTIWKEKFMQFGQKDRFIRSLRTNSSILIVKKN